MHAIVILDSIRESSLEEGAVLFHGSSSSCRRFKCLEQLMHARICENEEKFGTFMVDVVIHLEQYCRPHRMHAERVLDVIST